MRVLLLILIPFLSFSQQQQPGQFFIATGTETFAWNTQVLQSVTDIATCSTANNTTLSITDTVRGGRFVRYTGADAADGGMIFTDALGGKWKRVITDGISIAWYGAATAQTGVNNRNYICNARVSTQYDNTTTTLGNVTGLTANVAAGKIYRFEAKLYTTSDVAGGIKVAIGGTATATAIRYEGLTTDAGLTTQSRSAALGTAVGAVTAAYVTITGTITVNAAGTLTVQAAANAATGTTSVLTGSTFVITEML